jgi:hypothetical protein
MLGDTGSKCMLYTTASYRKEWIARRVTDAITMGHWIVIFGGSVGGTVELFGDRMRCSQSCHGRDMVGGGKAIAAQVKVVADGAANPRRLRNVGPTVITLVDTPALVTRQDELGGLGFRLCHNIVVDFGTACALLATLLELFSLAPTSNWHGNVWTCNSTTGTRRAIYYEHLRQLKISEGQLDATQDR